MSGLTKTGPEASAFRAIAQGDAQPNHVDVPPPVEVQALADRGLVTYLPDLGWRLTYPAGYELAENLGLIERPDATEGSPGDPYDPPAGAR
jgi:hypothetical protein